MQHTQGGAIQHNSAGNMRPTFNMLLSPLLRRGFKMGPFKSNLALGVTQGAVQYHCSFDFAVVLSMLCHLVSVTSHNQTLLLNQ